MYSPPLELTLIPLSHRRARAAAAVTAAGLIVSLAACTPATSSPAASAPAERVAGLPGSHIHGMAVNDQPGQILLATHEACSTSPAPPPPESARAMT
jgi:hypothetical protein